MKLKYMTTALAATALSIFSANADHHEKCETGKCDKSAKCEVTKTVNTEEATKEAAAVETVTAYKVVFKGKGWGVGAKASSVLNAQKEVKEIILSGLNAIVFMNDGAALDKSSVENGLKEKGLEFVSAEKVELEKPKATYVVKVKGLGGWTEVAEKVRVALEKHDNIIAAYVNNKITLLLNTEDTLKEEALKEAFDANKLTLVKMSKVEAE